MYRYGNGVRQDYDTALTWYQKSINAGNDSVREEKAELEREIEAEKGRERQKALAVESSNTREDNSNTAMAVGAGIGLFVAGPLGAVVGGWLGNKFFGK